MNKSGQNKNSKTIRFAISRVKAIVVLLLIFLLMVLLVVYVRSNSIIHNKKNSDEFSANDERKKYIQLIKRIDALEDSLAVNELYLAQLSAVVNGNVKRFTMDSLMAKETPLTLNNKDLYATKKDSLFRNQVEENELAKLKQNNTTVENTFYKPANGIVTNAYDIVNNHLAVDIAAPKGDNIQAISNGFVIFKDWSPKTGNTIIVYHKNNVISIYKHCAQLFKDIGENVEKGDVIASVGNSGELTTGSHLHFELWVDGKAVNPTDFIEF